MKSNRYCGCCNLRTSVLPSSPFALHGTVGLLTSPIMVENGDVFIPKTAGALHTISCEFATYNCKTPLCVFDVGLNPSGAAVSLSTRDCLICGARAMSSHAHPAGIVTSSDSWLAGTDSVVDADLRSIRRERAAGESQDFTRNRHGADPVHLPDVRLGLLKTQRPRGHGRPDIGHRRR